VLFTPFVHHLSAQDRERILHWVHDGGTWVCGPGTGDRTEHHTWHADSALGGLESAAGVESIFQFPATGSGSRGSILGHDVVLSRMSTFFRLPETDLPGAATALGTVTAGPAEGLEFATERKIGAGRMILLGSYPGAGSGTGPGTGGPDDGAALAAVVEYACAGMLPPIRTAGGTVAEYPRWRNGRLQHWLVNMGGEPGTFTLRRPARRLLGKQAVHAEDGSHPGHPAVTLPAGVHALGAYDYLVLEDIKEEHAL